MPRLSVHVPLRWGDMDAFGHVNNATIVQILEQARVLGLWAEREVSAVVVARHEIEYLAPIPYTREPVRVDTWISRIGGSSFEVSYEIHAPDGAPDVLYVRAATVIVLVDPETGVPRRATAEEREEWSALLDEPIRFRH